MTQNALCDITKGSFPFFCLHFQYSRSGHRHKRWTWTVSPGELIDTLLFENIGIFFFHNTRALKGFKSSLDGAAGRMTRLRSAGSNGHVWL